ncbi:MAG: hypothetical protein RR288_01550, partial [Oscillibacter sp.]
GTQEGFLSFFNHPFLKLFTGFKNLPQRVEKAFSTRCGAPRYIAGRAFFSLQADPGGHVFCLGRIRLSQR